LPEVDSIIYSPILIGEKLVAEMSFILSNYPEFNTTLFNIFNGTCKSHDFSVIFKNVSDSKIVFFDALRQVISKKEYHDEIYQTLVRASDSVEENQNQQLNTSENNTGTTCIPRNSPRKRDKIFIFNHYLQQKILQRDNQSTVPRFKFKIRISSTRFEHKMEQIRTFTRRNHR